MRLLVLAQYFPPTNLIGAVRPYRIARHFADAGHDVVVLCADNPGFANNDPVDTGGFVVRRLEVPTLVRFLEPTRAGGLLERGVKLLSRQVIFPDHVALMRNAYVRAARELAVSGFVPQVVLSSSLPFSMHSAASAIAEEFRCRWVADNRDLWAGSPYRRRPHLLRKVDSIYEAALLNKADLITVIGRHMGRAVRSSVLEPSKVVVVRNGADFGVAETFSRAPARANNEELSFVYTGSLYSGLRDLSPLFRALEKSKIRAATEFYGSERANVEHWRSAFPALRMNWHAHVAKAEIRSIQRAADFLVVALGTSEFEKGVLTGKFFEYVESRRPIIAICDEDSELGELVVEHGLGVASRDPSALRSFVAEQVKLGLPDLPPPPDALRRSSQLKVLEDEVLRLVGPL